MKKIITILLVFFSITLSVAQHTSTISSAKVSFVFVDKDVDGTLSGFESNGNIDLENIQNSSFEGSVAVETLKTGNFLRDWSLKGGKYFDAKEYPSITFEGTSIEKKDGVITVKGNLTLKDVTEVVVFKFKQNGKQLKGTASINAYDYGIAVKKKREENRVAIQIELNFN